MGALGKKNTKTFQSSNQSDQLGKRPLVRDETKTKQSPIKRGTGQTLFSKTHMEAQLELIKKHIKDSWTLRNKVLCSDVSHIELFHIKCEHHVWRKHLFSPARYRPCSEAFI